MKIILANIFAIFKRELQTYFALPGSYLIAAIFWLISGTALTLLLLDPKDGVIATAQLNDLQPAFGMGARPFDAAYVLTSAFLATVGDIALFILPILSMGLYSEERKRGTLELLATSPITNWAVAVGKLMAVVAFFIALTMPLMVLLGIVLSQAKPEISPLPLLVGYGSLILLATSILSLGMFISSLTDKTIQSGFFTFALVFIFWLIGKVASMPGTIGTVLKQIAITTQYQELIQGQINSSAFVMFGSYIVLGVFLTAQSIEAFRFQRS
jgi:ABC-2 type transport system permease protein